MVMILNIKNITYNINMRIIVLTLYQGQCLLDFRNKSPLFSMTMKGSNIIYCRTLVDSFHTIRGKLRKLQGFSIRIRTSHKTRETLVTVQVFIAVFLLNQLQKRVLITFNNLEGEYRKIRKAQSHDMDLQGSSIHIFVS